MGLRLSAAEQESNGELTPPAEEYIAFAKEYEPMKMNEKICYITMIAALYLVLCSISLLRYAAIDIRSDAGTVSAVTQLLCLGMALSAGAYFVRPQLGHKGLILFTVCALVAIGTANVRATLFHLVMLSLLILPYITASVRQRESHHARPLASRGK